MKLLGMGNARASLSSLALLTPSCSLLVKDEPPLQLGYYSDLISSKHLETGSSFCKKNTRFESLIHFSARRGEAESKTRPQAHCYRCSSLELVEKSS